MEKPRFFVVLVFNILISHAVGLFATGVIGTADTTAGLSLSEGSIGLFIGGLVSIPWLAALLILLWFYGGLVERHPVVFAVVGPMIVVGTYVITLGGLWEAVAISCAVSSLCYLLLTFWTKRWRTRVDDQEV